MIQAVLSNPSHPEYGVATIPFPIPRDQYAHCMELLEALEIGDAVKADCKVEKIDSALLRGGITDPADVRLRLEDSQLPNEVDVLLDMEYEKLSPTSTNWQRQRMGYQKRIWKSWALWSCWQSQSPRRRSKILRKASTSLTLPPAHTRQRSMANI